MNYPRLVAVCACICFWFGVYMQYNVFGGAMAVVGALSIAVGLHALTGTYRVPVLFVCLVCSTILGAYRYETVLGRYANAVGEVRVAVTQHAKMYTGIVVSNHDDREQDTRFVVALVSYVGSDGVAHMFNAHPRVRLTVPRNTAIAYNDVVMLDGSVTLPAPARGDNGFDSAAYLRAHTIVGDVRFATVRPVDNPQFVYDSVGYVWMRTLQAYLFTCTQRVRGAVRAYIDEPFASLGLGLILGEAHGLTKTEYQYFIDSGLSHIVVLSGFNITIVVTSIFWLLSLFHRRTRFISGSIVAVLFVMATGFSATSLRALGMAGIGVLALYAYRSVVPLVSLILVATAMIAWNPFVLRDDMSFHLSVLATLGIIVFGKRCTEWWSARLGAAVGSVLGSTCAASVYVVPYVAYAFGRVSVVFLVANAAVLPLVEPAMLATAVTGVFGSLPLGVLGTYTGMIAGVCAQMFLACIHVSAQFLGSLPYASVALVFPWWALLVWFLAASAYAAAPQQKNELVVAEVFDTAEPY